MSAGTYATSVPNTTVKLLNLSKKTKGLCALGSLIGLYTETQYNSIGHSTIEEGVTSSKSVSLYTTGVPNTTLPLLNPSKKTKQQCSSVH